MGRKRQLVADHAVLTHACKEAYGFLEALLGISVFQPVALVELLQGTVAQRLFSEKAAEYPQFLQDGTPPETLSEFFRLPAHTAIGVTTGAYLLDNAALQTGYLDLLRREKKLRTAFFNSSDLPPGISDFHYEGEWYTHLLLCNGRGYPGWPTYAGLPLSTNKGQALILKVEGSLPRNKVFKLDKKLTLCPWGKDFWWIGASFEWEWLTEEPTASFLSHMKQHLQTLLKIPFRVVKPLSGFRVSARDRRAVAGWLPHAQRVGVLNAMGTKGVLQAPAAAEALTGALLAPQSVPFWLSPDRFLPGNRHY